MADAPPPTVQTSPSGFTWGSVVVAAMVLLMIAMIVVGVIGYWIGYALALLAVFGLIAWIAIQPASRGA